MTDTSENILTDSNFIDAVCKSGIIVFDYDSTLVPTKERNFLAYRDAFRIYDIDITIDDYLYCSGSSARERFLFMSKKHHIEGFDMDAALETFVDASIRYGESLLLKPYNYVESLLGILNEAKCFIVTNNESSIVEKELHSWNLFEYFEDVYSTWNIGCADNKDVIYRQLADSLECSRLMMVFEDSLVNLEAAYKCKAICVEVGSNNMFKKAHYFVQAPIQNLSMYE